VVGNCQRGGDRKDGIEAIYRKSDTSKRHPGHKIYPYLLRGLKIDRPNQVWPLDITYLQMRRGFLFLGAVMDWHSRKILSWRLSNTMHADFCIEALQEAITRYGKPEIVNTDRAASSPARSSSKCSKPTRSPSAWTARDAGATTS